MRGSPFPEKTEEILFTRYFLQACGMGKVDLYAPSTWEEHTRGYDASMCSPASRLQIYLQFKAPTYSERKKCFRIKITPQQHHTLQDFYKEKNSAYYVTHTFRSLEELYYVKY